MTDELVPPSSRSKKSDRKQTQGIRTSPSSPATTPLERRPLLVDQKDGRDRRSSESKFKEARSKVSTRPSVIQTQSQGYQPYSTAPSSVTMDSGLPEALQLRIDLNEVPQEAIIAFAGAMFPETADYPHRFFIEEHPGQIAQLETQMWLWTADPRHDSHHLTEDKTTNAQ